ncbi:MAG: phosphoribosylanthranilate isomerase [archaeon]
MALKVKICGITRIKDAEFAIDNGADAIGILLDVPIKPVRILKKRAKLIIKKFSGKVWIFTLIFSKNPNVVIKTCNELKPSHVQIIHDFSLKDLTKIKESLFYTKMVKSVNVIDKSAIKKAINYSKIADIILLDTKFKNQLGGTGKTHDWNISKEIVKQCKKPVFLAGGLHPGNVIEAIKIVKPYGVDVCTKLDKSIGIKDLKKVKEFLEIVKKA